MIVEKVCVNSKVKPNSAQFSKAEIWVSKLRSDDIRIGIVGEGSTGNLILSKEKAKLLAQALIQFM